MYNEKIKNYLPKQCTSTVFLLTKSTKKEKNMKANIMQ